jgi:hypothetical protein
MPKPIIVLIFALGVTTAAQQVPQHLRGRCVIKRELPTSTISCWDDKEAKQLIGTTIEYRTNSFRWKDKVVNHPAINVRVLTAKQFHDENSGSGANSSQVTFQQLGIRAPYVRQVELAHEAADITGATTETPGDRVLMKGRNTIVFSVCNVYFEAQRAPLSTSAKKSRSVPRTWTSLSLCHKMVPCSHSKRGRSSIG